MATTTKSKTKARTTTAKAKAKTKAAPTKTATPSGHTDLDSLLAEAHDKLGPAGWNEVSQLMKSAPALVQKLPAGQRVAAWERVHEAAVLMNLGVALIAAKALVDAEPKAPAAVRAVRLAKLAVAENAMKQTEGYKTFQQAIALAEDDETRGKVLRAWMDVTHDQVTPLAAALDALELANAGKLSDDLARDIWDRAAVGLVYTTNAKSQKGQEKLLAARGVGSRHDIAMDACRRWIAATMEPIGRSCAIVSTLRRGLIDAGDLEAAAKLHDEWTPKLTALHEQGRLSEYDLHESWWGGYANTLSLNGHANAAAQVTKQLEKLRGD